MLELGGGRERQTYHVRGNPAVGEAAGAVEVLAVGAVVGLGQRVNRVVIARVDDGVAEHQDGRHPRPALISGDRPAGTPCRDAEHKQQQQGGVSAVPQLPQFVAFPSEASPVTRDVIFSAMTTRGQL
jgi:hypothetical protein